MKTTSLGDEASEQNLERVTKVEEKVKYPRSAMLSRQ